MGDLFWAYFDTAIALAFALLCILTFTSQRKATSKNELQSSANDKVGKRFKKIEDRLDIIERKTYAKSKKTKKSS